MVRDGRSLIAVLAGTLPTFGGACCVGLGAGFAVLGGTVGAVVAGLTPLLLGAALILMGVLLVRLRSSRPWLRWHGLTATAAASYAISAVIVMPLLSFVLAAPGAGVPVLP